LNDVGGNGAESLLMMTVMVLTVDALVAQ